jgi:hypothetical protein
LLWRQASRTDGVLDAALMEDFHRAAIDGARLGMNGCARMPLHQQRTDAGLRQQDGRGQSHRTAADDHDGNVLHMPRPAPSDARIPTQFQQRIQAPFHIPVDGRCRQPTAASLTEQRNWQREQTAATTP